MRSHARLIVGPDPGGGADRVERMVHAAPIGWRRTPGAVYMVGTSASPVADDDVTVEVEVRPGASLTVRSTAATVVWRGRAAGTRQRVEARVGAGGGLHWRPEPLVATAGCDHRQEAAVAVAAGGRLCWEERIVLGRHGEGTGRLVSALKVDVGGAPLLRHTLATGRGSAGWDGPSVLGAARAVGLMLVAGPCEGGGAAPQGGSCCGGGAASGHGWAVMPLAGPGTLALAIGADALQLDAALGAARAAMAAGTCRRWPPGG